MSMTIYGLKNCDTCRKALKLLRSAGKDVRLHDVREDGVTVEQISSWLSIHGKDTLVNTRSTTWRGLKEAEKDLSNLDEITGLLKKYPTLIKRPIIVIGTKSVVGWGKSQQEAVLA